MIKVSTAAGVALKADTRYIKAHIDIFFSSIPVRLDNYFMSFDISEQNSSTNVPFGNVVYNELTITLDNIDSYFTLTNELSPYYNKLVAGTKVVVTYEVEVSPDIFENIEGGTFYTADWTASTATSTATLLCYDKLFITNTGEALLIKPELAISIREAFKLLFTSVGLLDTEYVIDPALVSILPAYWTSNKTFTEELADLALASCVNVFVDKSNKIRVQSLLLYEDPDLALSDSDLLMSIKDEASYTKLYDSIKVTYSKVKSIGYATVYTEDIVVPAGIQTLSNLTLNECPVTDIVSIIIIGASTITMVGYTYNEQGLTIELNNIGVESSIKLEIAGEVVKYENAIYTKQDPTLVRHNGLELTLPLAQNYEYVKAYADTVLSLFSSYSSCIELEVRALPILEINDRIRIVSEAAKIDGIYTVTSIDSSFENGLMGKITAITAGTSTKNTYAYIGPGMYVIIKE